MKIRSNTDRVWSLAGIRFEPGRVITFDILKCNDLRQLKAVVEEIRKGNITVVEQDDYFKPASITKVEQPQVIKKESQEDIVVVTRGGTFTDEIPKDVLTENTIQSVPVTIDVEKQSEPVVGEGNIKNESSTEAGFVVLPGKKPGDLIGRLGGAAPFGVGVTERREYFIHEHFTAIRTHLTCGITCLGAGCILGAYSNLVCVSASYITNEIASVALYISVVGINMSEYFGHILRYENLTAG